MAGAIAAALVAASCAAAAATEACLAGAATALGSLVGDPRSVTLADGRQLRLAGIETFALLVDDGDAAEAALEIRLQELVAGRPLRVRWVSDEPDRYGRLPALVATADEQLLQQRMVDEGLAIVLASGESVPCLAALLEAEAEARRLRRGFWADHRVPQARPAVLAERIGRFAIFEGTVLSVGNRTARTYLNFGTWWARDVTVTIEDRYRERFGGEAELAKLSGRHLRVRGFVEERGGPLVNVRSPSQIEVLVEPQRVEGSTP